MKAKLAILHAISISLIGTNLWSGTVTPVNDSAIQTKWSYLGNTGPERWAQLNPDFAVCSSGRSQSPINITRKVLKKEGDFTIHYTAAPLKIINNGTTTLMLNKVKTIINDGHAIQINFSPANKEFITFAGTPYQLIQFHIHSPSENQWHSQSFPLEIHFVHQSKEGQVAVVGVFVKGGAANPALQEIVEHLPPEVGVENTVPNEKINPSQLIPNQNTFYTFMGSLTTPPCTEGLQWIVLAEPITATPAQILRLRKAAGGENARSIQPLYGRQINQSSMGNSA